MIKDSDVIFRWVNGHVVPIRVKEGADPAEVKDPKERFKAFASAQREAEGLNPALRHKDTGELVQFSPGYKGLHPDLYAKVASEKKGQTARGLHSLGEYEEGFVDPNGKFLTRDEAEAKTMSGESVQMKVVRLVDTKWLADPRRKPGDIWDVAAGRRAAPLKRIRTRKK